VATDVCTRGMCGGLQWGPRVYNAIILYKTMSKIQNVMPNKTTGSYDENIISAQCGEPFGGRPPTLTNHVVSSPL